jgi:hypothetical protein
LWWRSGRPEDECLAWAAVHRVTRTTSTTEPPGPSTCHLMTVRARQRTGAHLKATQEVAARRSADLRTGDQITAVEAQRAKPTAHLHDDGPRRTGEGSAMWRPDGGSSWLTGLRCHDLRALRCRRACVP